MSETLYTPTHLWLRPVGEIAVAGFSAYGEGLLQNENNVALPEKGAYVTAGDPVGASVFDFPVSGIIVDVNTAVLSGNHPFATENETDRWFFKTRMTRVKDLSALLSRRQYEKILSYMPKPAVLF